MRRSPSLTGPLASTMFSPPIGQGYQQLRIARPPRGPGSALPQRPFMNVVIVESVAKAKAINKYLGSRYKVLASYGHVRDLPSNDGSVDPDKDFAMHWDVDGRSSKVMREIADAVKKADKLILATDPDREGEAISWHILRILEDKKALKKGVPVERVTFNAVTRQSVLEAFK